MTEHDTIEAINGAWYAGYKQGYEAACNRLIPGLKQHLEEMIADTAWKVRQIDRRIIEDEVEE